MKKILGGQGIFCHEPWALMAVDSCFWADQEFWNSVCSSWWWRPSLTCWSKRTCQNKVTSGFTCPLSACTGNEAEYQEPLPCSLPDPGYVMSTYKPYCNNRSERTCDQCPSDLPTALHTMCTSRFVFFCFISILSYHCLYHVCPTSDKTIEPWKSLLSPRHFCLILG